MSSLHRIAPPLGPSRSLDLYGDLPTSSAPYPNSAPDVEAHVIADTVSVTEHEEAHHKKYAKEVWPGKAPTLPHAVV